MCWKPSAKRLRKEKSEFELHSQKVTPAPYFGMSFEGLIHHYKVDQKYRNKIACNEFFELVKLFKIDDVRVETPFVIITTCPELRSLRHEEVHGRLGNNYQLHRYVGVTCDEFEIRIEHFLESTECI